jgi:DNA-binding HxlR family transcriptional regulator
LSKARPSSSPEQAIACPLQEIVSTVTKKWFLLVLNQIGNHHTIRYNQMFHELSGISPKSLADTLKELQKANLIQREIKEGAPPKVEYSLTKDGEALRKSVIPLLKWVASYTHHSSCPILGITEEHMS